MNTAIISLTENGRKISARLSEELFKKNECTRYAFEKYTDEDTVSFSALKALVGEIFGKYNALIFISACGIAIRMTAPYIVSKLTDPAVIAVDELGKFAVSLLSGHIGGANALTEKIAEILGAVPVITTATDIGGKFSPDSFAKANNLHICETDIAKMLAAAVVNEEKIGLFSDYPCKNFNSEYFSSDARLGICISDDISQNPFKETLHLVPKNIEIGVGCKKNTPLKLFSEFITAMLGRYNIPLFRVCLVNTIDIKRNEQAIIEYSKSNGIPLKFHTSDELMSVEGDFSHSDFVMKTVGADNICERSAAIGGGKIIVPKQAENGMTFAAAQIPVDIDFERKII